MRTRRRYRSYSGRRGAPAWLKVLLALVLAGILAFAALEVCIGHSSETRITGQPQVMVIFGSKVETWGPSQTFRDRLDAALGYLSEHPDVTVVAAGGQGEDESMSEAACVYDYLRAHGFEGTILLEDRSRNTWQNITYSLALLEAEGLSAGDDVLCVSNGFHLLRIRMLWSRATGGGSPSTLAAPVSHGGTQVKMFFREPVALVKSFLIDR